MNRIVNSIFSPQVIENVGDPVRILDLVPDLAFTDIKEFDVVVFLESNKHVGQTLIGGVWNYICRILELYFELINSSFSCVWC